MSALLSPPAAPPPAVPPCPIPPDADFFLATDAEVAEFEAWLDAVTARPLDAAEEAAWEAEADRVSLMIEADWLARQGQPDDE